MASMTRIHVQQQQEAYVARAADLSETAATAGEAVERLLERLPQDRDVEVIIDERWRQAP